MREDALTLLSRGQSLSSVTAGTGVNRSTLREWVSSGGACSDRVRSKAVCPRDVVLDCPAEYAHLLRLYLGDGCAAKYPRLIDDCARSMHVVVHNVVGFVRAPGCIVVGSTSRHWPCLFPQHGPSHKHEHEHAIVLADWQRALVQAQAGDFVRGLVDSDGCRVTKMDGSRGRGVPQAIRVSPVSVQQQVT